MEEHSKNSSQIGKTVEAVEAKYVSGLSTILVATIQEAKDRISQIEYIFCSQLYPTFQTQPKNMQKVYSDAQKAVEDTWKEKEKDLLRQIESLKLERQQVLDENLALKLEKERKREEFGDNSSLLLKLRDQQERIERLKMELKQKSREVDDGMELHSKLVQLVQVKTSEVVSKDKQLKEHGEEVAMLRYKVKNLEEKVDVLEHELREKTEIVHRKTEVTNNLLKKVEVLSFEATKNEQKLADTEQEKNRLITRLEIFEENVGRLEEMLRQKLDELEEGRKLTEQLHRKLDSCETELLKNKQLLLDHGKEKKLLLDKTKCLEEEINLHFKLRERRAEGGEGRDACENLHQQYEQKSSELALERKKRNDAIDALKRVKSQYIFLCRKFGLITENNYPPNRSDDEGDPLRHHENLAFSPVVNNKNLEKHNASSGESKAGNDTVFGDVWEKERVIDTVPTSSVSPIINLPNAKKCPSSTKSTQMAGIKRPASSWRATRSGQYQGGPDPHDDFLDTPLENIKKDLNKTIREEDQGRLTNQPDSDDDETQDINPDPLPQKQRIQVVGTSTKTFKYVEPVRKKAERENLKGVECKQCKKFYDAVLPENGGKDCDGNKKGFRCEHHDGVSRHRYKYVPPMTPEGFWNIGFESEM